MIQDDTRKLLGECDAGIRMALHSIDEVLPSVESTQLRQQLNRSKEDHQLLWRQTHDLLHRYDGRPKAPGAVAKTMSTLKTTVKLTLQPGDQSVADLLMDGCNMGIKSLHKYCNRYPDAAEEARTVATDLIAAEQRLQRDLRSYL